MPKYVIDAVLIHELAHLAQAGHGPEFVALTQRFPLMQQSDAFLAGVEFGSGTTWADDTDAASASEAN